MVFGFRASRSAVDELFCPAELPEPGGSEITGIEPDHEEIAASNRKLNNLMDEDVGIERNAGGLKGALKEINSMMIPVSVFKAGREYLELQNKLEVSFEVAKSALAREKSCGAHFRSDQRKKE
ncbi:MAG: hypothetical protein ACQES4_04050 [Bacillota bacterium]